MKLIDLNKIEKKESKSTFKSLPIYSGSVYLFYGESMSGKTAICLKICKDNLMKNKDAKVLYIDTEDKVTGRLHKAGFNTDVPNLNDRFCLGVYLSLKDFKDILFELEDYIIKNNITIIVIDSIAAPYQDIKHPKKRASEIKDAMKLLKTLTQKYNLITLVTTHIYRNYMTSTNPGNAVPIGGGGVNFYSDEKFQLKFVANNPMKRIVKKVVDNNEIVVEVESGLIEEK
jgi:RecA/RadA recombinase